ncbi:50S ribosomal protein L19e [Salinarchaeum laminariae]|uniref:50S ribosomal protein L19e n=1 Tax=Salinarchaeum laminariae TaxID=869888 RepID=UPI0020BDD57A|nr:50S ribosomal protein L19e [Salinarchaeum laminariae]
MTDLSAQKRLAADVLDVGENRIWLDPEEQDELVDAITREDIRELVDEGAVRAKPTSGNSRGKARERSEKRAYGHQTGAGSRKGKSGGRQSEKDRWTRTARAQRQTLRELRDDGVVTPAQYRALYNKARGGEFPDVRRLLNFAEDEYQIDIDRSEY